MTRCGVVTQARTTSTRLPGKVLLPLGSETVLDLHLKRLAWSGLPVLVATTTNVTDDPIVDLCARRAVPVHRGSEGDVLARFAGCVREHSLDVVVRVTSDCPLVDGHLVRALVNQFLDEGDPWLYLSNTLVRTFPRGFDIEVFSAEALLDADARATALAEREHVTPYLYRNLNGRMHLVNESWLEDRSGHRVTLDTADDLRLLRALVDDHGAGTLGFAEVIALLEEHPELSAINARVEQKEL